MAFLSILAKCDRLLYSMLTTQQFLAHLPMPYRIVYDILTAAKQKKTYKNIAG